MKQITVAVITALSILYYPPSTGACTSFAVYSNHTRAIYGMNFDYTADVRQMFAIATGIQGKIFQFRPYGFGDMAGMNTKGLFSASHMLIPEQAPPSARSKEQISTWIFHQMVLSRFERVSQVSVYLEQKQVVQSTGTSMHNLVADKYGQAMVVEPDESGNQISKSSNQYIVMSSFPYYTLKGKNFDEAEGDGADRFKIAHQYIRSNIKEFNIEKGLEVLKLVRNRSKAYATRCSMLFDPDNKEIYISLEANFDKIWKVSLENQSIETHRGFDAFKIQSLPATGLPATELLQW